MTIPALLQIRPLSDRRAWDRHSLSLGSNLEATGELVTIHDISSTGMLIETAADLAVFDILEVQLPEAGTTPASVVWTSGRYYGCEFTQRISHAAVSAARLRSPAALPEELELPLPLPAEERPLETATTEGYEQENASDEYKAPLAVRLRVILGTAIILWTLVIWAAVSFFKLIRG